METAQKAMRTITVVRPFRFIEPATDGQRIPPEHKFMPNRGPNGEYVATDFEVEEWIADHEYLSVQLADGAIEAPQVRAARVAAEEEATRKRQEIIDISNREGEEAVARATGNAARMEQHSEAMNEELNAPLGTPAAAIDQAALQEELNTPVHVLRARAAAKRKAGK